MSTTNQLRKLGPALCLIAGLAAFGSGFAQDGGGVEISNAAYQEVEVEGADGTVTTKLVPAAKVVPGDAVVYEVSYANKGSVPATGVVVDNPVPRELVFVEFVGTPATAVSVDGGVTYGALSRLQVDGADGMPRAAQNSDVTNLRWELSVLRPGENGRVSFRARVK